MVKYKIINTAVFNTTRFMLTDVSKNNALNEKHWIFQSQMGEARVIVCFLSDIFPTVLETSALK